MIPLISCAQASRLDSETLDFARLEAGTLMEVASVRMWDRITRLVSSGLFGFPQGRSKPEAAIVALCGAGNNAADALVILRHARFAGFQNLCALLCRETAGGLFARHKASLEALGVPCLSWSAAGGECKKRLEAATIVLDGLSGTGLRGALRGSQAEAAGFLSSLPRSTEGGPTIVAIDLPSGLSDSMEPGWPVVRADLTLSVEPRKLALYTPAYRSHAGSIEPIRGVFPESLLRVGAGDSGPEAALLEPTDLAGLLCPDDPDDYKGSRGRLAVFAGAPGTTGAASLASRAALASGAGYVALHTPKEVASILASKLEEVMVRSMDEVEYTKAFDPAAWDAILAGPGWMPGYQDASTLARLLETGLPMVIDAGAIALFGSLASRAHPAAPRCQPIILTPHPGEFRSLCATLGEAPSIPCLLADPVRYLVPVAERLGVCIVLKSHVTWIASPGSRIRIWDGRESGLGTAGSGDVLAGLTAGLLARHSRALAGPEDGSPASLYEAASAAVIAHGCAGKVQRQRSGWFTAGDLIPLASRFLDPASTVDMLDMDHPDRQNARTSGEDPLR